MTNIWRKRFARSAISKFAAIMIAVGGLGGLVATVFVGWHHEIMGVAYTLTPCCLEALGPVVLMATLLLGCAIWVVTNPLSAEADSIPQTVMALIVIVVFAGLMVLHAPTKPKFPLCFSHPSVVEMVRPTSD